LAVRWEWEGNAGKSRSCRMLHHSNGIQEMTLKEGQMSWAGHNHDDSRVLMASDMTLRGSREWQDGLEKGGTRYIYLFDSETNLKEVGMVAHCWFGGGIYAILHGLELVLTFHWWEHETVLIWLVITLFLFFTYVTYL
jgi:hypothetical protein